MVAYQAISIVVHAVIVLSALGVAVVLLAADPRRDWNRWLAFFLVLIAVNFGSQGAIHLASLQAGEGKTTPTEFDEASLFWTRIGYVALALDPFALVYFVSVFPRRTGVAARPGLAMALLALALGLVAAEVFALAFSSSPFGTTTPARLALFGYLAACYGYAAWRITASSLHEPSTIMAQQVRLVAVGVLVATLPRIALVPGELGWAPEGAGVGPRAAHVLQDLALAWAGFGLLAGFVRYSALPIRRRQEAARLLRQVAALLCIVSALWITSALLVGIQQAGFEWATSPPGLVVADIAGTMVFAVRWVVFAALMLYGIARFQAFAAESRT
ncbi:MAG: hypothetical protein ACRDHY_02660, partial [Anaerolineales bacterium]